MFRCRFDKLIRALRSRRVRCAVVLAVYVVSSVGLPMGGGVGAAQACRCSEALHESGGCCRAGQVAAARSCCQRGFAEAKRVLKGGPAENAAASCCRKGLKPSGLEVSAQACCRGKASVGVQVEADVASVLSVSACDCGRPQPLPGLLLNCEPRLIDVPLRVSGNDGLGVACSSPCAAAPEIDVVPETPPPEALSA